MSDNPYQKLANLAIDKDKRKETEQEEYQRGYDDYMREHSVSPYEQGRRDAERDLARRQLERQWDWGRKKEYDYVLERHLDPFGFWRIT